MRRAALVLPFALAGLVAGCADPNAKSTSVPIAQPDGGATATIASAPGSCDALGSGVVASADGVQITGSEIEKGTATQTFQARQQIHEARSQWAQNELMKRLLQKEADKEGLTIDAFLEKKAKDVRPVTDADVKMFYSANPQMMKKPDGSTASFDEIKDKIRQYLEGKGKQDSRGQYLSKLFEDAHGKIEIPEPEAPIIEVAEAGNPAMGPKDAPVTVVEFSDFQCPACRQAFMHLDEMLNKYDGRVRFVYRDFPLTTKHPNAFPSAVASNCVRSLGGDSKYWEFNHKLFNNQSALAADDLKRYATDEKIDAAKFTACVADSKMSDEVKKDMEDGDKYGINSTPTFFVNGRMVPGSNLPEVARLIEKELKKTGS